MRLIYCPPGTVVKVLRNTLPSGKPKPPFLAVVTWTRYNSFRVMTPKYCNGEFPFGPLGVNDFEIVDLYESSRPFLWRQRLDRVVGGD